MLSSVSMIEYSGVVFLCVCAFVFLVPLFLVKLFACTVMPIKSWILNWIYKIKTYTCITSGICLYSYACSWSHKEHKSLNASSSYVSYVMLCTDFNIFRHFAGTFSNAFCRKTILVFWNTFHRHLFPRVQKYAVEFWNVIRKTSSHHLLLLTKQKKKNRVEIII